MVLGVIFIATLAGMASFSLALLNGLSFLVSLGLFSLTGTSVAISICLLVAAGSALRTWADRSQTDPSLDPQAVARLRS